MWGSVTPSSMMGRFSASHTNCEVASGGGGGVGGGEGGGGLAGATKSLSGRMRLEGGAGGERGVSR